jgi:hypothetical protein
MALESRQRGFTRVRALAQYHICCASRVNSH